MNNTKYEKISFILSMIPIAALVEAFLFCFISSGGSLSEAGGGAVWWLFIIFLWLLVPTATVLGVISLIFGIISLKAQKSKLSYISICIAVLDILGVVGFLIYFLNQ